tara:strand:- start:43 stop:282 length:240 start_codon:yes stop_codon:yes gene_type:complete
MIEKKKYLIEINNYGEGKPKKVEVQSEMDLADMFGYIQSSKKNLNTDDKIQDFWDEIDRLVPEYDCNNDEIAAIWQEEA